MSINPILMRVRELSVSELVADLTQRAPAESVARTLPCYTGHKQSINPQDAQPEGFIGPLERIPLPDSQERRAMWLAPLCYDKPSCEGLYSLIPEITFEGGIDFPKYLKFPTNLPGQGDATKANSFDFAFQADPLYVSSSKTRQAYTRIRCAAFQGNPERLLHKMGYEQVKEGAPGDLVVYYGNCDQSNSQVPSYREKGLPSHYGRIVAMVGDDIYVRSKFNDSHIYRHRIDCVPYFFGNSYLLYTKK